MIFAADTVHSAGTVRAFLVTGVLMVGMPALAAAVVAVCDWLDRRTRGGDDA